MMRGKRRIRVVEPKPVKKTPAQGGCPMVGCVLVHSKPPLGASIMRHYDKEHIEANRLERELIEKSFHRTALGADGYPQYMPGSVGQPIRVTYNPPTGVSLQGPLCYVVGHRPAWLNGGGQACGVCGQKL